MIKISNLHKSFANRKILDGVTLEIKEGEIFCLLGKSGVGKSVLIKTIVGLIPFESGEIEIDNISISTATENDIHHVREKIGILFQGGALLDSLNVEENVGLVLKEIHRLPQAKIHQRVEDALQKVNLHGINHLMPSELSGGMKKRVGLARAIITKPKYIFYDEPTTGLDPIMCKTIDELIHSISKSNSITSFIITHDLTTVFRIATKVGLLEDGKIQFIGSVDEFRHSSNPFIDVFLNQGMRIE